MESYKRIKAANDKGSIRLEDVIDIEVIAERLGLTEYELLEFCRKHELTLLIQMNEAALEMIEEIGYREGLLTLTDEDLPPVSDELDSHEI